MKKSKYHNQKTTVDGVTFDSKKEANSFIELNLLVKAGIVRSFMLQPEFTYTVRYSANNKNFEVQRKYIADFQVNYDDHTDFEDVKGVRTAEYKRKKKIVEKLYGIKIVEK